ncbi:hypothetical protein ASD44_09590 [Mesorhizobium sp. Root554]|uniref:hypothetical protein n=1 Tax=unclassified Mesorhizobium TaxID=325217 RepID=UPI0006FD29E6|nr:MULTISPECIES: hypothetical protein [unclassified Mesorhizobium]KQZ14295.1 hypothetical protein ASD27_09600 [Mesorhizobium sp. Root1471]KQZ36806.1 hypothetical protein ASD44_09590 [Mesorhizobium sp. Root554]
MAVTQLTTSWLGYDQATEKIAFWDGVKYRPLQEAAGYAAAEHTHAIDEVSGLPEALDAKLPVAGGTITGNLGVGGAAADDTNRLAVTTPAVLFNRETDDIRAIVNKQAAGNTASFLFQTGFSGRAEIGLTGDDDFHFKVSLDGSTFHEGLVIDAATGAVRPQARNVADMPSAAGRDGFLMLVWDGDAGAKCLAVSDGSTWRRIALGATISAS